MLKKKELAVQKKADREAKKAQITAKTFFNWINKNPPDGVQLGTESHRPEANLPHLNFEVNMFTKW